MFQSKPGKRKCQLLCQKNAFYSCTGVVLQTLWLWLCIMVWGLFCYSIMRWFSNKQRRMTFIEKRMMSWSEPDVSLLAPSLMRLAMTLTCVTHSNWFVCTSFKWMLLNVWMVKMSLLCPDCCWESGRWQSSGRNIYHHLATTTTTPTSSPPGNSKRIRPISQKQVLPCLTISCHAFLFLSLGGNQLQLQSTTSPAINPLVPGVTCVPWVNMMTCCRPGLPRLVLSRLASLSCTYVND